MQKTFASLLVTLAVSVMGIPVAYLVGQRSAEHGVELRLADERARARTEQQALIADLRGTLAPRASAEAPPAKTDPAAVTLPPAPASVPASAPAQGPSPAPKPEEKLVEAPPLPAHPAAMENATPSETVAVAPQKPAVEPLPPIQRETFNAVALGLKYVEVVQRFGREGVPALTMQDAGGTLTREYYWQWPGPEGRARRATLRFVDGQLTEKSWRE